MPELGKLPMPGVLYLHGFCSSSKSAKGEFLSARFRESGVPVALPDLDEGDFEHTTMTRQLALVSRLAHDLRPSMVIGSSLGGYLAALHAARSPDTVPRLVLMAPAFDFASRISAALGARMTAWRQEGGLPFYHYGLKRDARLDYGFFEDASRYEAFPAVGVPTRVLHGRHDESVDPALSTRFARESPHVEVQWYDTDHQMLDVVDNLWDSILAFYKGGGVPTGPR